MYGETGEDGQGIHAQALGQFEQIFDFENLARHEKHDAHRRVPHDELDQLHDNLVENDEEVQHGLAAFAHRADGDSKGTAEGDQTYVTTKRSL